MLVSCQQGHLEVSMLLSSYGASRVPHAFKRQIPPSGSWALDLAKRSGNQELVSWLQESATFGPLQHVEVLTPKRTLALLRSGASPLDGGSISPSERARKHPESPSASLILRAGAPWSPASHELWGPQQRAFAVELLKIGYRLSKEHHRALLDVWVENVLPCVLIRGM